MSERISSDEAYLDICGVLKQRATCLRAKHAAVMVGEDGHVVSMGYNGSPHGQPHCLDAGCLMDGGHCARCLHAEMNMLLHAWEANATVYITSRPCFRCATALVQCGVARIVVDGRNPVYTTDAHLYDEMLAMFQRASVVYDVWLLYDGEETGVRRH